MGAMQNLTSAAEDALNGGIFKHPSIADNLRDAIAMTTRKISGKDSISKKIHAYKMGGYYSVYKGYALHNASFGTILFYSRTGAELAKKLIEPTQKCEVLLQVVSIIRDGNNEYTWQPAPINGFDEKDYRDSLITDLIEFIENFIPLKGGEDVI